MGGVRDACDVGNVLYLVGLVLYILRRRRPGNTLGQVWLGEGGEGRGEEG